MLLATALITVVGENGLEVQARALIDPCSQSSFVSGSLSQRLRLKSQKVHIPIRGTGGSIIATATKSSLITVKSRVYTEFSCTVEVLIIPKVSSYAPPSMVTSLKLPHLEGLRLADPQYMCAAHIDVLLGASVYSQIIKGSVVKGRADEPIATNSSLGWLLSGNTPGQNFNSSVTSLHISSDDNLDSILQKFWTQEEVAPCPPFTKEEQACDDHFARTHSRDSSGRFVVRLPFKGGRPSPTLRLGESFYRARSMLLNLEKRFERDPKLKEAYTNCLKDYEISNHDGLERSCT